MPRHEKDRYLQNDCGRRKEIKVTALISMEEMVNELPLPLDDNDMHELSDRTDPTNEDSTCVKRKIAFWTT